MTVEGLYNLACRLRKECSRGAEVIIEGVDCNNRSCEYNRVDYNYADNGETVTLFAYSELPI